ncbi:hypothetical protein [Amnibacterium sp.]|uniref:hypothetical protein n=1 Tax=Amnibacterium sp. TaxID=1872496 RepID=UPI002637B374|nr:hypothetical protein [Amnibacterium sp.]MCU1474575.1 hypothetical protein [Amnibacterium sp.]
MNPLGVVLVIAGCVIALGALASLGVLALIAVEPWSRFRPRYHRGVRPEARPAPPLAVMGRAASTTAAAIRAAVPDRRPDRSATRHPRGARHLVALLGGR